MAKKYIDAEKLRAEIEKRMEKHWDNLPDADSPEDDWTHNELCELGAYKELEHIEDFLDSLQQEQPEKGLDVTEFCKPIDSGIAQCVADHWWELLDAKDAKKKQPEVDLEKEMDSFFEKMPVQEHESIFEDTFQMIARHFYELGLKAKEESK